MTTTSTPLRSRLLVVLTAFLVVASACSSDDADTSGTPSDTVAAGDEDPTSETTVTEPTGTEPEEEPEPVDPAIEAVADLPGADVATVNPDGTFLVPTLFVIVDDGTLVFDLGITNLTGSVEFEDAGLSVGGLVTGFQIDTGSPPLLDVTVVAIPEPASLSLAAAGLLGLAALRRAKGDSR